MSESPAPIERPIIIIGGYHDIGVGPWLINSKLGRALGENAEGRMLRVTVGYEPDFESCRRTVIAAVDQRFGLPAANCSMEASDETVEVDVVAFSMGGIVARDAAMVRDGERRLNIRRLFTISTPHTGARWADELPDIAHRIDGRIADMQTTSPFIDHINDAWIESAESASADAAVDYEIIAYVRLGDTVVGPENAAPPGETPFWVSNPVLQPAHLGASIDSRIIADIARRLRSETPLTQGDPAPVPDSAGDRAG